MKGFAYSQAFKLDYWLPYHAPRADCRLAAQQLGRVQRVDACEECREGRNRKKSQAIGPNHEAKNLIGT